MKTSACHCMQAAPRPKRTTIVPFRLSRRERPFGSSAASARAAVWAGEGPTGGAAPIQRSPTPSPILPAAVRRDTAPLRGVGRNMRQRPRAGISFLPRPLSAATICHPPCRCRLSNHLISSTRLFQRSAAGGAFDTSRAAPSAVIAATLAACSAPFALLYRCFAGQCCSDSEPRHGG